MKSAKRIKYLLICAQIITLATIPGCMITAGYLVFGTSDIERLYVDKSRYPSGAGDRVIDIRDRLPDERFETKITPLCCSYSQFFSGRAVIDCVYTDKK